MVHFITLMVMFTKGNGKMINPMVLESTNILMESYTKDNGKMINNMVEAFKFGRMDKNIKDNLIWVSNQEKEFLNSMMVPFMKETFSIIKFMEKVNFSFIQALILGFKIVNTSEIGKIIKCMEKAGFNGQMEKYIKASIRTTESMVMVHLAGQMEENMLETGKMENNMEEENIIYLMEVKK